MNMEYTGLELEYQEKFVKFSFVISKVWEAAGKTQAIARACDEQKVLNKPTSIDTKQDKYRFLASLTIGEAQISLEKRREASDSQKLPETHQPWLSIVQSRYALSKGVKTEALLLQMEQRPSDFARMN
jgi:hypothetical protein